MNMHIQSDLLALRRRQLLAQSASYRADLRSQCLRLAPSVSTVTMGFHIMNRLRQHPEWIMALVLGLAIITPSKVSSFFRFGILSLQTWRQMAPALRHFLPRH